jgi:hypothetical protein
VRSTTFLFITLCTSIQILGENDAQSCLVGIFSAELQPRRDVMPAKCRAHPRRVVLPARVPKHVALPEVALSPRQRTFPRRARTPRAAGVRAAACRARTRGRSVHPCCPRAARVLPVVGPPILHSAQQGGHRATIKKAPQGELLARPPSTARATRRRH